MAIRHACKAVCTVRPRNLLVGASRFSARSSGRFLPTLTHTLPRLHSTDAGSHTDFMPKRKVADSPEDAKAMIEKDISSHKVFLYMKGNPQVPMCGFSKQVVGILDYLDVKYGTRDVLQDANIRNGIKAFSDWPTIPQLYVEGEFVGGCDIVTNMFKDGQLIELLHSKNVQYRAPPSA
eukprot:gb/GEZN01014542.1/.p2 GENE.gb/GEZN01014542.1/~~gb/GEZN01014542.1/.p2  ORF type:complete len:178 (+),score=18.02 gb/GEZN01014542.1/:59-592(+)